MTSTTTKRTVLLPGRLIDGLGNPPRENMAVVVQGQRISWVGPREEITSPAGPVPGGQAGIDYRAQDFPEATLLPGLIDCHTHTNMPGDGRRGEEVHHQDIDDIKLLRSAKNAGIALRTGVTTLCDAGSWSRTGVSLRQGVEMGLVEGPRVLVSGNPITITGGHLWFMGGEADGVDEVRRMVRRLCKEGVDFIKLAASGGSTATSDPFRPSFSLAEVQAIVDEAHGRAKPVFAHCRSTAAIGNALDAGVDVIFHSWFYDSTREYRLDEATAERLAGSGTWINPTLNGGMRRRNHLRMERDRRDLTPVEQDDLSRLERIGEQRAHQFGKLIEMGARLVGGSDCGWGRHPFGDFQGELMAMAEVGLSPMQAIVAGTRNCAAAAGILDKSGTIEPGKYADLLLVEGDPSQDLSALRKIRALFKEGKAVDAVSPAGISNFGG